MKKLNIKFRITLWYALFLLVLLSVFNVFLYLEVSMLLYRHNSDFMKADASQVESILQFEGNIIRLAEPYKIVATNTYFVVFDASGNTNLQSETLPEIVNLPVNSEQLQYIDINGQKWAVFDKSLIRDDEVIGWIRVIRSLESVIATLDNLKLIMFISIPLYILFSSLGGFFLAGRALRPIDYITRTAREISKGDLSQRLKLIKTEDEVGRLSTTFNEMLDKLSLSIRKERQFASDASHELRTPTAVITAQAEQVLSSERKKEEYQEALQNILNESKKMSFIISQLLLLYRSDEGQYRLDFETINLNMIVEEILNEYKNNILGKRININFIANETIKIKADQTLITRMLINLVDNSIRYGKKNGKTGISICRENTGVKIIVEDNGTGIQEEDIPNIFDRFYQVNKSRNGQGTGLGLSIVKWIVETHNGTIKVESHLNTGTRFTIILP